MQDRVNITYETPIGRLALSASPEGLVECTWIRPASKAAKRDFSADSAASKEKSDAEKKATKHLNKATKWLDAYWNGRSDAYKGVLVLQGTDFQKSVWEQLKSIPWGQTKSYSELAAALENPKGVRAVAAANRANPLCLFVPCHRVIGADGSLTGYSGGLRVKRALLLHEGVSAPSPQATLFATGR